MSDPEGEGLLRRGETGLSVVTSGPCWRTRSKSHRAAGSHRRRAAHSSVHHVDVGGVIELAPVALSALPSPTEEGAFPPVFNLITVPLRVVTSFESCEVVMVASSTDPVAFLKRHC